MPRTPETAASTLNSRRDDAATRRLARRLAKLRRLIDLNAIDRQTGDAGQVVTHYHQEFCPDRGYLPPAGAMHMALNADRRFDEDSFFGQGRRIERLWKDQPPPRCPISDDSIEWSDYFCCYRR